MTIRLVEWGDANAEHESKMTNGSAIGGKEWSAPFILTIDLGHAHRRLLSCKVAPVGEHNPFNGWHDE